MSVLIYLEYKHMLGMSHLGLQCTERNWEGWNSGSTMVFLVHVCADLFRELVHACLGSHHVQKQTERDGSVALLWFS